MKLWSFHSVKGGVGKSTLATLTALHLARSHPDARVWLLDLDLTGTSLADGLPLMAPRWEGDECSLPLKQLPTGFYSVAESLARIRLRQQEGSREKPCAGAPFLNDWLLHAAGPAGSEEPKELPVEWVAWAMDGVDNLRVIPSSALPNDLLVTIPVVFDEEYTAFFEARLEHLLCEILTGQWSEKEHLIVLDVPPTIPGLSRAVLGLALRLSRPPEERISLSVLDRYIPPPLDEIAEIEWRACLVASLDRQDIRALRRWLELVKAEEQGVVRVVLNRVAPGDMKAKELALQTRLEASAESEYREEDEFAEMPLQRRRLVLPPALDRAAWVEEDPSIQLFNGSKGEISVEHPQIEQMLKELG